MTDWLGDLVRRASPFGGHLIGGGESAPTVEPEAACPVVPLAPPGAALDDNLRRSKASLDPFWFYDRVRNHGPWDFKQQGKQYQDFGNFNYGATAAAFGFPPDVIRRMAGYAQQRANTSKPAWGSPLMAAPYGDDPNDQAMINAGMQYWASGCGGRGKQSR